MAKRTPVLAGVNATDPFLDMSRFLKQLKKIGFAGVQNFPTVGLIDGMDILSRRLLMYVGNFRLNLEETGFTYQLEIDMVRLASQMGLLTTPYVFSAQNAEDMARAGADIVVCHLGLTSGGSIGV